MGVRLVYSDIALGADEDAAVTATEAESFSDIFKIPFGVEPPAIATCEPNGWGLSGDYQIKKDQPFAFWSTDISGADCVFASAPSITLTFTQQYISTGLTVRFAPESMDYCRKISITWYQGATVKDSRIYYPDKPNYVINNTVEAFDKIVFEFLETALPNKRCKVEKITLGVIREFGADELKSLSTIHEVDMISSTIPINVLDAGIHSKDEVDYIFQRKQPVEAYNSNTLIGIYYITTGQRTGKLDYIVSCQDAVGLLDLVTQAGGLWLTDTPLTTILSDVFGNTIEFDISPAYANSTLRGYIEPDKTMREALRQIAFALGAVVDTSGTNKVKIFPAPSGTGSAIDPKKTYTGGTVAMSDAVTEVTVTAYIISDERPDQNEEYIEYNGVKYKYYTETKHAYNQNVVSTDPENKIKYTGMYLCNLSNAQTIANNIMAYYQRRDKYTFGHVLYDQIPAGRYTAQLPWNGTTTGNITKMTIKVSGITVSNTDVLLDE